MIESEVEEVFSRYEKVFGVSAPRPFAIHKVTVARICSSALESGVPVPGDFDWWSTISPNAR